MPFTAQLSSSVFQQHIWSSKSHERFKKYIPDIQIKDLDSVDLSVQFTCSVMSDSLWHQELQHTRCPCPKPTPGVYTNSCPLSWWCHPTISASESPSLPALKSFPASGSFQMSRFFASGDQIIGISASTSDLPMNTQDWSPLDGLVGFPCSPRISQESSPTAQFKSINSSGLSFLYSPTLMSIDDYWKNHGLD